MLSLRLCVSALAIAKAASHVWCDNCKDEWGTIKDEANRTVWHKNAQRQAIVTITSETHITKEPVIRSLCGKCVDEASRWHDGSVWSIQERIAYAKANRAGQQLEIGSI